MPDDGLLDVALERAAALARNNQCQLTIIKVIEKIPPVVNSPNHLLGQDGIHLNTITKHQRDLEELFLPWRDEIEIDIKILIGKPFLEIVREVLNNGHDLVIKTAQTAGLYARVFGNSDIDLLRKCPCPVWLVNANKPRTHYQIMAAVDVGECYSPEELKAKRRLNTQILEVAGSLASSDSSVLHVVHVLELFGQSAVRYEASNPHSSIGEINLKMDIESTTNEPLDNFAENIVQQHRRSVRELMDKTIHQPKSGGPKNDNLKSQLLIGSPRKQISAFAEQIDADLIIMGAEARTYLPGVFAGNTAEAILGQLSCSVFAIKPQGFVAPVTVENRERMRAVG